MRRASARGLPVAFGGSNSSRRDAMRSHKSSGTSQSVGGDFFPFDMACPFVADEHYMPSYGFEIVS